MTPGIYLLKFVHGSFSYYYVGKSVDIKRRIDEHIESFLKGKAAKKLQSMYDLAGSPEVYILQQCHPDHIDVLEAYYIDFYKGPYSLNTVSMKNPFHFILPEEHAEYLMLSTDTLIKEVIEGEDTISRQKSMLNTLNDEILELERKRSIEEIEADIDNRIGEAEYAKTKALDELLELKNKVEAYNKLPWYKKMFTKPL